jgi:hemolysin D
MGSVEAPAAGALPLRAPGRRRDELEFLPAALEIVETPPAAAAGAVVATLILLVAFALIWAIFARVDIVTSASGRVVPSGRTKIVQPFETSVVRAIEVRDGQKVMAGRVLLRLDATIHAAERERLQKELMIASLDAARLRAAISDSPDPLRPLSRPRAPPRPTSTCSSRSCRTKFRRSAPSFWASMMKFVGTRLRATRRMPR